MTAWVEHIKKVAKDRKITYKAAMSVAASSWTKGKTRKIAKKLKGGKNKTKKEREGLKKKGMTGQTKSKKSKTKEDYTEDQS